MAICVVYPLLSGYSSQVSLIKTNRWFKLSIVSSVIGFSFIQIFWTLYGTDLFPHFCASQTACSCIDRATWYCRNSGMTRPAPVFFYMPWADALQDYLLQVLSDHEGTADDFPYISPSFGTGCIHLYYTCLAECTHIPPLPCQVSLGTVSHIPLFCLLPAFLSLKAHFYNGSSPVPEIR